MAITVPGLDALDESAFLDWLGTPEMGAVRRSDKLDTTPLPPNVPSHIVWPTMFAYDKLSASSSVQIIDYGEAYFDNNVPATLHTPLVVRAPEVVFDDTFDRRADLWSAGCLLFELVTGQPPFDNIMPTKPDLVEEMIMFASDALPSRWQDKWQVMQTKISFGPSEQYTLQEWLEKVYFEGKDTGFSKEDITSVGRIVQGMFKFEPAQRATARETLADVWFKDTGGLSSDRSSLA